MFKTSMRLFDNCIASCLRLLFRFVHHLIYLYLWYQMFCTWVLFLSKWYARKGCW